MNDELNTLIASIYESALDPNLWAPTLAAAAKYYKASKALFHTLEMSPAEGGFFASHDVPAEAITSYDCRYRELDPWVLGHARTHLGCVGAFTGDMLVSYHELMQSEFHVDFMRRYDLYHICTSVVRDRPERGQRVALVMHRGPKQSAFDEQHRRVSHLLTPHLQRALLITERLKSCEMARRADWSMLDNAPAVIFLVDANGRVRRMTAAAEMVARSGQYLAIRAGHLSAPAERRFSDAIAEVLSANGTTPFSRVLSIQNREQTDRTHVLIAKSGVHLPGLAYVVVGPVGTAKADALGVHLKRLYRITPAEAHLCELLMRGLAIAEAAELLGIQPSTAATQLKSVFAKTGTARQSDLMRLLLDIAALG